MLEKIKYFFLGSFIEGRGRTLEFLDWVCFAVMIGLFIAFRFMTDSILLWLSIGFIMIIIMLSVIVIQIAKHGDIW